MCMPVAASIINVEFAVSNSIDACASPTNKNVVHAVLRHSWDHEGSGCSPRFGLHNNVYSAVTAETKTHPLGETGT